MLRRAVRIVVAWKSAFGAMVQIMTDVDSTASFQRPNHAGVEDRQATQDEIKRFIGSSLPCRVHFAFSRLALDAPDCMIKSDSKAPSAAD